VVNSGKWPLKGQDRDNHILHTLTGRDEIPAVVSAVLAVLAALARELPHQAAASPPHAASAAAQTGRDPGAQPPAALPALSQSHRLSET